MNTKSVDINQIEVIVNKTISKKQFDAKLSAYVRKFPRVEDAAKEIGISAPYLRNILCHRDVASARVAEKIGYKPVREIKYRYEPLG